MALEITPTWDPTGTLTVRVDRDQQEVVVSDEQTVIRRFVFRDQRPDRLSWVRQTPGPSRRVSVADVVANCLDWDAQQEVIAISTAAVDCAALRGGRWRCAAKRLRNQVDSAGRIRRIPALPFQRWWKHDSDPRLRGEQRLTLSEAAVRAGYQLRDGRADTSRLERRLGLRAESWRGGRASTNQSVNYATALTLCEAFGRDPVELGL